MGNSSLLSLLKNFIINLLLFLVMLLVTNSCEKWKYEQFTFTSLEFPFENPADIKRLAGFGIPNWSGTEPHNGIDLIIYEHLCSTSLVSPVKGTIRKIEIRENPFSHPEGQLILSVEIYINKSYQVHMVIEPGTADNEIKSNQINALQVKEGQVIEQGEIIGELLVGEMGYPHLHFMMQKDDECVCAYNYSSSIAKEIFNEIIETRENNSFYNGDICGGYE